MITIYTIAYNEEFQLPFFIEWYNKKFGDCEIVIYDNYSTDRTVEIAKDYKCQVIQYNTNNKLSDFAYLSIKNNCWKSAKTDWVCIVDVDECVDVTDYNLIQEECYGNTLLRFSGFNMVNMNDDLDINNIKYGCKDINFNKDFIFNKKYISHINYTPGCHSSMPDGLVNYTRKAYSAYHFNFINLQQTLLKYKEYAARLSEENIKNGWGSHYLRSEEQIKEEFNKLRSQAIKIL